MTDTLRDLQAKLASGEMTSEAMTEVALARAEAGEGPRVFTTLHKERAIASARASDLLRQAGAGEAQLLLFCLDGEALDAERLHAVHEAFPQAAIFLRAFDRRMLIRTAGAPVQGAVREVFESAVGMGRMAMAALGVDETEQDRTEDRYRRIDAERLALQTEANDIYAARDRIITTGHVPDPEAVR